jgi:glycosyltransferase involved in cell wall biosynthesis
MARQFLLDVTKRVRQEHASGLNRVSQCLERSLSQLLGDRLVPVRWNPFRLRYQPVQSFQELERNRESVFLTPETFALRERKGCRRWMELFPGRTAVIGHDAIPFRHPEITWPHSVRRFPHWLHDLTQYDEVFSVSHATSVQLRAAGEDLGIELPPFKVLTLGGDYTLQNPLPREPAEPPILLMVGILEPRKGQTLFLQAVERLWEEGWVFEVILMGRANPHFGRPILERLRRLQSLGYPVRHETGADDTQLAEWHAKAHALVLPSLAEGCGLPVWEALWAGCPVIASGVPSAEYLGATGGLHIIEAIDGETLVDALRESLKKPAEVGDGSRVPRWDATARSLLEQLAFS